MPRRISMQTDRQILHAPTQFHEMFDGFGCCGNIEQGQRKVDKKHEAVGQGAVLDDARLKI